MNSLVRSTLATVAAAVALAGCATYGYAPGYPYSEPYYGYPYGYNYGYGPYYYDYGPSYYVGPSVGLGFTYRDYDRGNYDRHYDRHRHGDNDHRRGDNDQWRGDQNRSRPAAPLPSGRDDPWGGTNIPFGRNSQQ